MQINFILSNALGQYIHDLNTHQGRYCAVEYVVVFVIHVWYIHSLLVRLNEKIFKPQGAERKLIKYSNKYSVLI